MGEYTQDKFNPVIIGVNAVVVSPSAGVGCFLANTAGTLTIVTNSVIPRTLVAAFPVAAGQFYWMPFAGSGDGMTITAAGGASGTLGVE